MYWKPSLSKCQHFWYLWCWSFCSTPYPRTLYSSNIWTNNRINLTLKISHSRIESFYLLCINFIILKLFKDFDQKRCVSCDGNDHLRKSSTKCPENPENKSVYTVGTYSADPFTLNQIQEQYIQPTFEQIIVFTIYFSLE